MDQTGQQKTKIKNQKSKTKNQKPKTKNQKPRTMNHRPRGRDGGVHAYRHDRVASRLEFFLHVFWDVESGRTHVFDFGDRFAIDGHGVTIDAEFTGDVGFHFRQSAVFHPEFD